MTHWTTARQLLQDRNPETLDARINLLRGHVPSICEDCKIRKLQHVFVYNRVLKKRECFDTLAVITGNVIEHVWWEEKFLLLERE